MSTHQRQPVPLRLVQSMWDMNVFASLTARRRNKNGAAARPPALSSSSIVASGGASNTTALQPVLRSSAATVTDQSPYLVVWKPCGLPVYSPTASTATTSATQRFVSPSPLDLSDCLMHRLVDNMAAGATPRVVGFGPSVPTHGSVVAREGQRRSNVAGLLQLLSRGLVAVATSNKDAMFLQDCMRFELLTCTYYVLVHVPPCVHAATQHAWDASTTRSQQLHKQFRNPYLVEHLHRRDQLASRATAVAPCGVASTRAEFGIRGSLFDRTTGQLLREGSLGAAVCRHQGDGDAVRRGQRGRSASAQQLQQARRLARLFDMTETVAPSSADATSTSATPEGSVSRCALCAQRHEDANEPQLALQEGHLVGVPRGGSALQRRPVPQHNHSSDAARNVDVAFRLVETSAQRPLALYHVSTTNATEEDIAMLFASQNLFVAGDVAYNRRLGRAFRGAAEAFQQAYLAQLDQPKASGRSAVTGVLRHRIAASPPENLLLPVLLQPAASSTATRREGSLAGQQQPDESGGLLGPQALRTLARAALAKAIVTEGSGGAAQARGTAAASLPILEEWLLPLRCGFGFGIARTQWHLPRATPSNHAILQKRIVEEQLHLRSAPADAPDDAAKGTAPILSVGGVSQQEAHRLDNTVHDIVGAPPSFTSFMRRQPDADADCPMRREEEQSELYCPICCAWGHTMQQCAAAHDAPLERSGDSDGGGNAVVPGEVAVNAVAVRAASAADDGGGDDATPSTLRELRQYLEERGGHRRGLRETASDEDEDGVVKVPNEFKADQPVAFNPHARRHRQKTPPLHRKHLRCAYCHSVNHHITECPRLQDTAAGSGPKPGQRLVGDAAGRRGGPGQQGQDALPFCICCGQLGHVYAACPTIPKGLHSAIHCAICHMPRSTAGHEPETCPRRVRAPSSHLPSGAPRSSTR